MSCHPPRMRIYLIADFAGECADKILFERESVPGRFAKGATPWQRIAADAERGAGRSCYCPGSFGELKQSDDKAATLRAVGGDVGGYREHYR